MADTKITALAAIATVDPAADVLPIVDISDTSMAASGTTKKVTSNQILGAGGTATLASATITGDLTVDTSTLKVNSTNDRVGVNTATPESDLDVRGLIAVRGTGTFPTTGVGLEAYYSSANTSSFLQSYNRGSSAFANLTYNALSHIFQLSSGGGMTLNSTGLGIGGSPTGVAKLYAKSGAVTLGAVIETGGASSLLSFADVGTSSYTRVQIGSVGNTLVGIINGTQAMTLDASGNLLVGIASNPNTARAYFRYDTLTTQPVINSASVVAASTSWSHFIGQSGDGSSITTNNIFIYGNGNIQNVNGVYGTISDLRLKENVADARNYLSDLLKLRVVKYSLKEEASAVANKLGFIAQEVEQVFPAMVDTDPNDGNKGIKTSVLIPMLVKAIQELTARVQTLEAR